MPSDAVDTDSLLPLVERDFHILASLTDGERHGYGLVKTIAVRTGGALELDPAYLYRSIQRLIDCQLVAETGRRRAPDSSRMRRYFRITARGKQVLVADAARMRRLVEEVESKGLSAPVVEG